MAILNSKLTFISIFIFFILFSSCATDSENIDQNPTPKVEFPIENSSFSKIKYDQFPGFYTSSEVADFINKNAQSDTEKTWMLYCWIAENISYNAAALTSWNYGDLSPEGVFQSKMAVCTGFANLFESIGKEMGLEILTISGFAKGYSYVEGSSTKESNHVWNAVKLNGEWKLIDSTWGQGYVKKQNGKDINIKQFNDFWFATEPYQFLFTHFPEEEKYQFMDNNISNATFKKAPKITTQYFKRGLINNNNYKDVFSLKIDDLVKNYTSEDDILIQDAPIFIKLKKGNNYTFNIKNDTAQKMAIVNNKEWLQFEKNDDNEFTFSGELKKGKAVVATNKSGGNNYDFILEYEVR